MDQFSTNEQVTLQKLIEANQNWSKNGKDLKEYYELDRIVQYVNEHGFQTVCLQFPDYMLCDSYQVANYLNKHLDNNVYIMADSSYESCCIDYITAQHKNADAIIHFGPRCTSEWTETIPSLCIYEKDYLNPNDLLEAIQNRFPNAKRIFLTVDRSYIHVQDKIEEALDMYQLMDHWQPRNCINLYVGENNRNLLNYALKERVEPLHYFNPKDLKIELYEVKPLLLKRRLFLAEKLKDAKRVGIVIATLVIKNFLKAIDRVKKLLTLHNKKYYVISVGKPTVAKLANFPEMDAYVLVCCPSSNIFESREFYKPIVSIYDVEVAFNDTDKPFSYEINADFLNDDIKKEINEPDVSLISGGVRWDENTEEGVRWDEKKDSNELVLKEGSLIKSSGAEYLDGRSFKGLEQNLGKTEVKMVKDGRKGIAGKYENEMF